MIGKIKAKASVYVLLANAGLLVSGIAIYRAHGAGLDAGSLAWVAAGVALLYLSFIYSAWLIWSSMHPWVSRYEQIREWSQWIVRELPAILAMLPVLISALQTLKAELSSQHAPPSRRRPGRAARPARSSASRSTAPRRRRRVA